MIALLDCNSFYASCEKIFRPDLRDSPVVVLSNNDSCIVAASGEAKEAGIKRAQPLFEQKRTIEENRIAVFSSNYALYADISRRIMGILKDSCSQIEVYSIDEAFIHIPERLKRNEITEFASNLKNRITQWTGVPVSVGIGKTKTLSKIASRMAKKRTINQKPGIPGGIYIIDDSNLDDALAATAVEEIWMVGRQYAFLLHKNGIHTALDLKNADSWWIKKHMSITGYRTQAELKGDISFPPEDSTEQRKAIVSSRQFGRPVTEIKEMKEAVSEYAAEAAEKLHRQNSSASSFTVFIETNRYREEEKHYSAAFTVKTEEPVSYIPEIISAAQKALSAVYKEGRSYRKAGIIITDISDNSGKQLFLFSDSSSAKDRLTKTVRELNIKYGKNTVASLSKGTSYREWVMKREKLSPCYTTRMDDFPSVFAN